MCDPHFTILPLTHLQHGRLEEVYFIILSPHTQAAGKGVT
jgi:hypothetical protein